MVNTARSNNGSSQLQKSMQNILKDLRIVFRAVQSHSKTVEKACGLSGAKLWMLLEIDNEPGIKISQLAEKLTIHASTCSNMLDKLEIKHLILRNRSKIDQRSVHVSLSEQGKELLARAPQPAKGALSNALEGLPEEQIIHLEKGLQALINSFHNSDRKAAMLPISREE